MKEARLLHFTAEPVTGSSKTWYLSRPTSKGMPVNVDIQPANLDSFVPGGKQIYPKGMIGAVTEVVGEGGAMHGWEVHSIGKEYEEPQGRMNAVVIVVKDKAEGIEAWRRIMAANECLYTPGSSVTMGR